MRVIAFFALALVLPVVAQAASSDPAATELLARIQAVYKQGGDLSANFEQISVEAVRQKKRSERGRLWAKRDGRVRWSYEQPTRKDFVYDGKSGYFYEPENAQVTVFERFQDSPLWNALRFLWGQGSGLAETFDVRACDATCPKAGAGETLLRLTPKKPIASIAYVVLAVDAKTALVKRSIVFDSLGNRTEYIFSDVKMGVKIDDAKFVFKIPPGVNILPATNGMTP